MSGTFARREQRLDRAHGRTQRSWSHWLLNLLQSLLLWGLTLALLLLSSACEPFGRTGTGPAIEQTGSAPKRATVSPTPTPTPVPRPVEQYGFQKGIVYPGWSRSAYGLSDRRWQESLQEIRRSTAAEWLEMPVLFSQSTPDAVDISVDQAAPSVASFVAGVRKAHEVGFKVFLAPLLTVRQPGGWAALVMPAPESQQRWFDHYWQALRPYVEAAEANGVEQIALATEMEWLQSNAPSALWRQLIERVRSIYTGNLTYDINWSTMDQPPAWLRDPRLTFIGVSEYISLSDAPVRLDAQTMIELWREQIKTRLDQLAEQLNRRIVITEIGYRNSADALYQVWSPTSTAPADPQEQADAYNAALTNVMSDEHIAGIFFWGWDRVARFSIRGQKASEVLHQWYSGSHTGPAGS
ncbi:glycoside hydrolase family 113 [Thermogemmatispora tikiterensis]|uniref:Glycoside hydrolase family 5 domain-containing protein n=1 Tax=Thermogemmatispora tikiterensis TaxID=1825093 RepID=A0A328VBV5_9CHLR|nr:hypothetical protein [Thermogemmatispora tikiterensis]RAQ95178.1 hypothetical protein A4R35_06500 [Thermogemmatispora tikiterensis]